MIDRYVLKTEAAKLNIELSDGQLEKLDLFAEMLAEKNKVMNLTAITEPEDILYKHFLDSMIVLSAYEISAGACVVDIGTGAGFPGMVMLIVRPDLKMTFLDSTAKKLDFIADSAGILGLDCSFLNCRAEDAGNNPDFREKFDVAVARAVAELRVLSELALPLVKTGGVFLPMKSRLLETELAECGNTIELLGGKKESIELFNVEKCGERALAVIRKNESTKKIYPRTYSQIKRKPL